MHHLKTLPAIIDHLSHLSYPAVFLAILASGHVVPVPEGVTLLILGYLAAVGKGSLLGFMIVGIVATVFFDLALYFLSLEGSFFADWISKRVEGHSLTHHYADASSGKIFSLVFFSHYVPGWRFLNPFVSGVIRISPKQFVPFTIISCAVYAPLYVLLGYAFHARVLALATFILSLRHTVLAAGVVIILAAIFGWFAFQKRR